MEQERCAVCGKPIIEATAWKRCGKFGEKVCVLHCYDTCNTLFGEHCIYSSVHPPAAAFPAGYYKPEEIAGQRKLPGHQ